MDIASLNLKIVLILTIGFSLATFFGYLTQHIKLSPILGYLLAGYAIGPFFPGFVADLSLAEQLAEVGVMLMMFGVGLHFKWQDLVNVKNIAIPGALGQTLATTVVSAICIYYIWGSWQAGVIFGLAIGVASTVVLARVLADNNLLNTLQGHIAIGWLIVEDILTVAVLILLPTLVKMLTGGSISFVEILGAVGLVVVKFVILTAIMFTFGRKFVSYALFKIARTRSSELFTLCVLALTFLIATGSALLFGTSIALGAFIAGMVIGQTDVRQQASASASPMKDAFVVLFFLSVGMLFNPMAIVHHFTFFLCILGIILIIKPLVAYLIVVVMGYPKVVALTVALSLAQIGEFSFILAEEADKFHIFPDEGYDIIVACALVSIALNPLLFKLVDYFKPQLIDSQFLIDPQSELPVEDLKMPQAFVVGYGLIGKNLVRNLEELGYQPIIVEKDLDTFMHLKEEQQMAVYGDASFPHLLESVHIENANILLITIGNFMSTLKIIRYTHAIKSEIPVIAKTKTIQEKNILLQMGVSAVCYEEEIEQAFYQHLIKMSGKQKLIT